MTHGSKSHRHGSIGSGTNPGRIYPGKRMHGHMGNEMVTTKGLTVMSVEDDCIIVKGSARQEGVAHQGHADQKSRRPEVEPDLSR